jgi:hypothetical protein
MYFAFLKSSLNYEQDDWRLDIFKRMGEIVFGGQNVIPPKNDVWLAFKGQSQELATLLRMAWDEGKHVYHGKFVMCALYTNRL